MELTKEDHAAISTAIHEAEALRTRKTPGVVSICVTVLAGTETRAQRVG
jgi:hypothetical protein